MFSEEFEKKFEKVTLSQAGDKRVAEYAKQAVLNNQGLDTEDAYFLNADNGKLISHFKLDELGGKITGLPKLKDNEQILILHNHPTNTSFSFTDFATLNDFVEVKTMIVAGHDETVYFLSVGNGSRLDLSDENEYKFFDRYWGRAYHDHGGDIGAIKELLEEFELRWDFYVK